MLIEMGIAPLAISEHLGHEDIQTTLNTRSHLYPNKQGEIAMMFSRKYSSEAGGTIFYGKVVRLWYARQNPGKRKSPKGP